MDAKVKKILEKQQYRFAGKNTAVKICSWTKNSIRGKGVCYKQKFYGVRSHRCVQMSPSVGFCHNRCILCWRPLEYTEGHEMENFDAPDEIIENCIKEQKKLLIGFGGNTIVDKKILAEALEPKHFAISLTGEPTSYPKLNELIEKLHEKAYSTFVVTNGMEPEKLAKLVPPTQLYLSVDAPTKELFLKIDQPVIEDAWDRLSKSLEVIKNLNKKTRTCLRFTMIKSLNIVHPEKWAEIIKKAEPHFVEVKSYMHVGNSKERLKQENMPEHDDIKKFAHEIEKYSDYKIIDEHERSRVVLMMKKDFSGRIMVFKD